MFNSLPKRLRINWKTSDLQMVFRVDLKSAQKKFLEAIYSDIDKEKFIKSNRVCIKDEKIEHVLTKIFHFNYVISGNDCIKEMKKQGCRPATDYETLTFCELNSFWAKNYEVCALGTKYVADNGGDEYSAQFRYETWNDGNNHLTITSKSVKDNHPSSTQFLGISDP